ncbi:MAG: glycoside hydrolase, partial [Thermoguttaceae bacterium]|nr:glycoside hydrolase [Thermoguttaceae bacterium]
MSGSDRREVFMLRVMSLIALLVLGMLSTGGAAELKAPSPPQGERIDARDIRAGRVIPDEGYCDQPYVVVTRDGNWLCTLTTGPGVEGQKGQHVVSTISADQGKTWSALVDIEPSAGPEASWVVPLVVARGRV